jgi:L-cysteine S-thiosulfotransferase
MSRHTLISSLLPALPAAMLVFAGLPAQAEPVSGYQYLTTEMQDMQNDDFGNPGMLAVEAGKKLFSRAGANGRSCASCHGEDGEKLDVRKLARYPVYSQALERPVTLRGRILICRNEKTGGPPLARDSEEALQLETFVRHLARGQTVDVATDGPMAPHYTAGEKLFHTRYGQVDIACHQCHDYHAGQHFRGQVLSQGQSNGFPAYRFTEGRVVGLQERFTDCLTNLRAEPYAPGSAEYTDLEVYMSARSNGLSIETPAIRY